MKKRFDPNYQVNILKFRDAIKDVKYQRLKLRNIVEDIQYGSSSLASEEPIGLPIIRMANMQNDEWDFSKLKYVQLTEREQLSYRLNKGDILFNRTNSKELVGKCNVFREEGHWLFASYLMRVVINRSKALPEFVSIFLSTDVGRLQINAVSRQIAGMTNINSEEIRDLEIVLPAMSLQEKVKGYYEKAQNNKRQQEAQAQALLDSIDGYLLGELGITLPPKPDNTIETRMFRTSWRQVSGGRFDPTYHQGNVYGPIANTTYELIPLRKLVEYFKTGFAAGRGDQDLEGNGIIQIRPTNMSSDRELIFEKNVRISPAEDEDYSSDLLVRGEVLFNNTNSQELVGKTVFFDLDGEYFCSNHITRIQAKDILNGEYLTHLFNLYQRQQIFFKTCINWNNQSGINTDILRGILIPLPPIDEQERIANHINTMRQQAQVLRQQAQDDFAKAKQKIEQMILE